MRIKTIIITAIAFLLFAFQQKPSPLGVHYSLNLCHMYNSSTWDLYLISNRYTYKVKLPHKNLMEYQGTWRVEKDTLILKQLLAFKYQSEQPIKPLVNLSSVDGNSGNAWNHFNTTSSQADSLKKANRLNKFLVPNMATTIKFSIQEKAIKLIGKQGNEFYLAKKG